MTSLISAAVITISDRCSRGEAPDASGVHLQELVKTKLNTTNIIYKIISDDLHEIQTCLLELCDVVNVNVIFTTGGTGLGPRDNTPEATKYVIEKDAPQITLTMALCSLKATKFGALSRAVSGIRKQTLIINLPGSKKAVDECFMSIYEIIPHSIELITNQLEKVKQIHEDISNIKIDNEELPKYIHKCSHGTSTHINDRNSKYPMIDVSHALQTIFDIIDKHQMRQSVHYSVNSPINHPPFRASMKDGYAVKSIGGKGVKYVKEYINAGEYVLSDDFKPTECFKINTGAPVPDFADCIVQIEDTKIVSMQLGMEQEIEVLVDPVQNLDIRPIGMDLKIGEPLFTTNDGQYVGDVAFLSMLASIGLKSPSNALFKVGIISTGNELIPPGTPIRPGQIYDSNTTMLQQLLIQFGFNIINCVIAQDNPKSLTEMITDELADCLFIICSGGVSMGDKDYVKEVLIGSNFKIHFGRVNMKPGKPMTFASNKKQAQYFFGLPGNPVSAFVTFHIFVLPALRYCRKYPTEKCILPTITVKLENDRYELDARPEYARAKIISKSGVLYASITGDQISSRLKSIVEADVLLHLPSRTDAMPAILKDSSIDAQVLKHGFISEYR